MNWLQSFGSSFRPQSNPVLVEARVVRASACILPLRNATPEGQCRGQRMKSDLGIHHHGPLSARVMKSDMGIHHHGPLSARVMKSDLGIYHHGPPSARVMKSDLGIYHHGPLSARVCCGKEFLPTPHPRKLYANSCVARDISQKANCRRCCPMCKHAKNALKATAQLGSHILPQNQNHHMAARQELTLSRSKPRQRCFE